MQQLTKEMSIEKQISEMSLAQKVGQMTMGERMHVTPQDVRDYFLGSVLSGGGSHPGDSTAEDWAQMNDEYWEATMGDGGFGIPILFGVDAVHGHNNLKNATIFPHNIGWGAARDPELMRRYSEVTAKEILASGIEWNFAPTLAVVQDPKWGRTYEGFGNDPVLCGEYGKAYVEGHQGSTPADGVIACVKHWVGDGGTLHGIDQGETSLPFEELEATHISPYYPALESGVLSVMVSFNSWNGDKCHGHKQLVTDVLKEKLEFDGIVVSDWDGIDYLDDDYDVAVRLSVNAGIDMFMVPDKWKQFIEAAIRQVEEGHIPESRIDDAVRRILSVKSRYGLFSKPRPSERFNTDASVVGTEAHRAVAREAVRKSLVLLKNDDATLPVSADKRILVAGKSANSLGNQCGGWTLSWQGLSDNPEVVGTSVWEGIAAIAPGAELSADLSGSEADPEKHDVAIVVIGETPYAEGFGDIRPDDNVLIEAGSMIKGSMNPLEPYARSQVAAEIHPEDLACIERIAATGVPVVAIMISGRPLVVDRELDAASAFVAAWLPGSEGAGIAEVLTGQSDFTGRLPMPWPREAGEFPAGYGLGYGKG